MSSTIRDVARRAGVSPSTVSRVLNGTCRVQEDKRRKVREAAQALGYAPNPAARSLLGKLTGGLGVLLPYVSGEFFSELLNGMDEAAQQHGFYLAVSTSHRHADEFAAAMQLLRARVDGLVLMAPELSADEARAVCRSGDPVLFINSDVAGLPVDAINFDNYGGARALTRHLLGLGHRRIALIRGPGEAFDARERTRGYRDAMAEAGLGDTTPWEVEGHFSREAGYDAARRVLQLDPRPTAIVAVNDYSAMGALSALAYAGLSVPGDLSVVGFDGLTSTRYMLPPLTTAYVPIRDIGYRAVSRLAARLRAGAAAEPEQQVVSVEPLVRASTGAPGR